MRNCACRVLVFAAKLSNKHVADRVPYLRTEAKVLRWHCGTERYTVADRHWRSSGIALATLFFLNCYTRVVTATNHSKALATYAFLMPRNGGVTKRRPVARQRPFLDANMRILRERIVGVPHRYWNSSMPSSAAWTIFVTEVLPPETDSHLCIRLRVEARSTMRDGSGRGEIIGPMLRVTPLLLALEKRTKSAAPPAYWSKRKETSRCASTQLKVDGCHRAWWLERRFLQGTVLLEEKFLPTASCIQPLDDAVSVESIPSPAPELLARKPCELCAMPRDSPFLRNCSGCDACFVSFAVVGSVLPRCVTGAACGTCGQSLCATCIFGRMASYAQRRDVRWAAPWRQCDGIAPLPTSAAMLGSSSAAVNAMAACNHAAEASVGICRDALWAARADGPTTDHATSVYIVEDRVRPEELTAHLDRLETQRAAFVDWVENPRGQELRTCIHCNYGWVRGLSTDNAPCPQCGATTCNRCGEACGGTCDRRRVAIGCTSGATWSRHFALESICHGLLNTLVYRCHPTGASPCDRERLMPISSEDIDPCACGRKSHHTAHEGTAALRALARLCAERQVLTDIAPSTEAERSVAAARAHSALRYDNDVLLQQLRAVLERSPTFATLPTEPVMHEFTTAMRAAEQKNVT